MLRPALPFLQERPIIDVGRKLIAYSTGIRSLFWRDEANQTDCHFSAPQSLYSSEGALFRAERSCSAIMLPTCNHCRMENCLRKHLPTLYTQTMINHLSLLFHTLLKVVFYSCHFGVHWFTSSQSIKKHSQVNDGSAAFSFIWPPTLL